ncbi:MAG: efflux RND transporter permease subunit [Sinobacteraceae bacterium]|nr:efflux RND transporter permease subunit [Nevskiaceae bacterium]
MGNLIRKAMGQNRAVLLSLAALILGGLATYVSMPKEFEPDVEMPFVNVRLMHIGISPEDAERLLLRPIEQQVRTLEGVKQISSLAYQDGANITLEFEAGRDTDLALADVRSAVDIAKSKLPGDTEEPVVSDFRIAQQQPILNLNVAGTIAERDLVELARKLKDKIELVPGVLEVSMTGAREEQLEVLIDPARLESYGLSQTEVLQVFQRNNRIVAAGSLQGQEGRFPVKVPGVFETAEDVLGLPIKVDGDRVVRFSDVASVHRSFKDAETYARINGEPAIALEVIQRTGADVVRAADTIKQLIRTEQATWPSGAKVLISNDRSADIVDQFNELQGHIVAAVVLVVILILGSLGLRNAALVAVSIPGSFLVGILVLGALGLSINMITMFALIISVGIVVDGAIIVVEFADRKIAEGLAPAEAYAVAAERMFWPVVCSIGTTLIAFAPLAFWPGMVGKMMFYMPVTLMAVLAASIVMALLYVPVMGAIFGKAESHSASGERRNLAIAETGNLEDLTGLTARYYRFLKRALARPTWIAGGILALTVGIFVLFGKFNPGLEFFPKVDPPFLTVEVRARGDLSATEKDAMVRAVEARLLGMPDVKFHYAKTGATGGATAQNESDQIGSVQLILVNWRDRTRSIDELIADARRRLAGLPGVIADVRRLAMGPERGKPIEIQVSARSPAELSPAIARLRTALESIPGVVNVQDNRPLPGIEWKLAVDRALAAQFGADVSLVGSAVQLITTGVKVGEYRPDDAEDEIDIRVRLPAAHRNLEQLDAMRITTQQGLVPISTFVQRSAQQKVSAISKTDLRPTMRLEADVAEGALADGIVRELQRRLPELGLGDYTSVSFKGTAQSQQESQQFLSIALLLALSLIGVILVMEFNSISQTLLILTAVMFATGGVMLGYLIMQRPFGLVMGGIGIITLAGIVVNNNIVLIDTYNILRQQGLSAYDAVLRTCVQRVRPVLLTKITIILALLPLVFAVNIDILGREVTVGGTSAQWWAQLSTAVVAGAAFATVLTLLFTPALILLQNRVGERLRQYRNRKTEAGPKRVTVTT